MPEANTTAATHAWAALTPTAFLDRAAAAHGSRIAVVDGDLRWTYTEFRDRCRRLAGALREIAAGRPVAVLAPNTHELLEAHYGVPWAGVPLVALNTRLGTRELTYILEHSGSGVIVCDARYASLVREVCDALEKPPVVIGSGSADSDYEKLIAGAAPCQEQITDENSLLAINYTSGTTGAPKGVMYHHRGAYLQSLAMASHFALGPHSVHLWTLPMFHCNGWCFTWAVTAAGGTHVCLPKVEPADMWRLIRQEGVTGLNGAPAVLDMIAHADDASPLPRAVSVGTGGAPPAPAVLRRMMRLGFDVTHLYGLTESFGPALICEPVPEWEGLDDEAAIRLKARQGVGNVVSLPPRVVDEAGHDVPADGSTVGEIALRGNNVMLGYLDDEAATREAIPDGWFRTGDLAVRHPDGYVELRDRSKDIIISGGENIASVEVEHVLAEHPAVLEAAVVGTADPRWGEIPVAFVHLAPGAGATAEELVEHVKRTLARYKAPRKVVFGPLPKTSTGKTQKYLLRARAAEEHSAATEGTGGNRET
ncbi:Long-chain-fatty-acid--CoA ligase [Nocardia cerradoensis]|uniref:Long-chain-fatty-acid--CoA ligase n=1 Tax=Nocardia cerradoensis TaxID=85688 RepID=A0A231GX43_9NOCA|nr:AMP-binding protein [Nocardia cerradoensis]OXR41081.1 Long-chain-fatty-acid--CoA ligase [Nocardia cerradoensis]